MFTSTVLAVTMAQPENHNDLTVAQAIDYWLANRHGEVKRGTYRSYCAVRMNIVGPLLVGSRSERQAFSKRGRMPPGAQFVAMLGPVRVADLTTASIRGWHRSLTAHVSVYTANVAKKMLRAALALIAEDFNIAIPSMPSRLGRGRPRPKKTILTSEQIALLLNAALADEEKGIYYAFPFLTGVRPSEQLAIMWHDIDFQTGFIRISRMQEMDGSITEFTKTAASTREIPMGPLLRAMLLRWQTSCPAGKEAHRVFPSLGTRHSNRHKQRGRALSYTNFLLSYWRPRIIALGLPRVTPHSARHAFISTLQAQGIEVGLVAKLAGHASVTVTLSHYTQAVRGGETAIRALEHAYSRAEPSFP